MAPNGEGQADFVLPVGTITLLLADVEGSVALWESDRPAMSQAVSRLWELVDDAVGRHGGVRPVEQGEGDSFVAAFARPSDALSCATELQLALAGEGWPGEDGLPVRMALHTGEVETRDERNYAGSAINRAARLRNIAHGHQTLLSQATRDLIIDQLPEGVSLIDMGIHRLRDLHRPEHVYQFSHPKLRSDFLPLRSLDVFPNNLPTQLTTFIGRFAELQELQSLLSERRLLTLTGSGGCGKTRIAIQLGAEVADRFPHGVWFVDLGRLSDSNLVAQSLAAVLGLKEQPRQSFTDGVVAHLKDSEALVLLDNCEHLVSSCAALVETLLRECPRICVVTTSREPLGVEGEVAWRVPSLSLPAKNSASPIDSVTTYDAVRLFVDRAVRARPNFSISNENAPAVAAICQRLDGIPLAIELAAARIRILTVDQIATGLVDRFHLLGGGRRTALPRQATLSASVDWSFHLLSEPEKVLFRRLAVFSGRFTLEAAEKVGAGDPIDSYAVLDLLAQLVDKSLVTMEDEGVQAGYWLLETIRAYAQDRLAESGEEVETRDRHLDYFLDFPPRREHETETQTRTRIDGAYDNLRAALAWARDKDDPSAFVTLAGRLDAYWIARSIYREGKAWLEGAVSRAADVDPELRARALTALGSLTFFVDMMSMPSIVNEALDLSRQVGWKKGIARNLNTLGTYLMNVGMAIRLPSWREQAIANFEEGETLARAIEDDLELAVSLGNLGILYMWTDPPRSRQYLDESYAVAQRMGSSFLARWAAMWLGGTAYAEGNLREARARLEASVAEVRPERDAFSLGFGLATLGDVCTDMGDYGAARAAFTELTSLEAEAGQTRRSRRGIFRVAAYEGNWDEAERLAREALEEPPPWGPVVRSWWLAPAAFVQWARGNAEAGLALVDEWFEKFGAEVWRGLPYLVKARLSRLNGDDDEAEELIHECLTRIPTGDRVERFWWGPAGLNALAVLSCDGGRFDEAVRLFGAAASSIEASGFALPVYEREEVATALAAAREELGEEKFDALWAEGRSLGLDEAIAYAQRGRGERKRPTTGWKSLTPTELDVVRLVAQGLTNPEIAERLFISRGTVKTHLSHVFAKLGVSTRSELTAMAVKRDV